MLLGLSGFLPRMLHVPSGLLSGAQMEVLWEKSAWRVKKTWRRHGDAHPLHTSHLRGLTRDTTPSHPACSHECRKTQHGNAQGYREGSAGAPAQAERLQWKGVRRLLHSRWSPIRT